ncbi:MAG: radical SAM protein [Candidatus Omnitrophota bacterium]
MTTRPIKIYFGDLTYTTLSLATEAFPLNIGFIAATCQKRFGKDIDVQLFKNIDELDNAIRTVPPALLGLSNYPWNYRLGKAFFTMVKGFSPSTVTIMGGPNIPLMHSECIEFIRNHPMIDFYTYLEGEQAVSNIVERIMASNMDMERIKSVPIDGSIGRINDVEVLEGMRLERRVHLDEIPSPYLTGLMDKFFDSKLSPMIETHRGCPFMCTYCHEGNNAISKVNYFSLDRVFAELDYIAAHVPKEVTNLMFADPNFGMYERDYLIAQHIAQIQEKRGWPLSIFASTGKNKKEKIAKTVKVLKGTMKVWLSVQSMDDVVLNEVKRKNIDVDTMMGLTNTLNEMGIPTASELILALPGETYASHLKSIAQLIEAGIDFITTYSLMLLNGTELNTKASREKYGIQSRFRIIPRDFARLKSGEIIAEIEEVVVATNTLSFNEYQKARVFHLILNVIYNGKGYGALFKYLREKNISVFTLLKHLVEHIDYAPSSVKALVRQFREDTRNELWESREDLLVFIQKEETFQQLVAEEVGVNLLQTYIVKSLEIMNDWIFYVFESIEKILTDERLTSEELSMLRDIKFYCLGKVHNIWGNNRNADNPIYTLQYDINKWLKENSSHALQWYKLPSPHLFQFCFSETQKEEMNSYLERFGVTPTGIGRIIMKMDMVHIWREAVLLSPQYSSAMN